MRLDGETTPWVQEQEEQEEHEEKANMILRCDTDPVTCGAVPLLRLHRTERASKRKGTEEYRRDQNLTIFGCKIMTLDLLLAWRRCYRRWQSVLKGITSVSMTWNLPAHRY